MLKAQTWYNKIYKKLTLLLFVPICACSSFSHNNYINSLKTSTIASTTSTIKLEKIKKTNINYLLTNEEHGVYLFLKGDSKKSIIYFKNALDGYLTSEQKYTDLSTEDAFAFASSDNVIPYLGAPYERVLDNYYQSLNYLMLKDLDSAMVEVRDGALHQKTIETSKTKDISKTENDINRLMRENELNSKDLDSVLNYSEEMRGNAQAKFLNANAFYVSGLIREVYKDTNNSFIDYKKAYAIAPNNPVILEDLYRLSLIYDFDFALELKKNHPELIKEEKSITNYNKENSVVVIYEQGFIPTKYSLNIPIFGPNVFYKISLPAYPSKDPAVNSVNISLLNNNEAVAGGSAYLSSSLIKLAKYQLSQQYPAIIFRELSRMTTQIIAQRRLMRSNNNYAVAAGILMSALSVVKEADTRSFRILPAYVEVSKVSTNKPFDSLKININGRSVFYPNLHLKDKEIAIIYLFDSGNALYIKPLYIGTK